MARTKEEVEGYVWDILINMSSREWMAYATEYMDELIDEGVYEKFLLEAYTGCSLNYHNWDIHELQWMFEMAERDKLLQTGDSLPGPGPFTIYRGVAGVGSERKVRGISWTGNFEKALWFARRFEIILDKPMVYETVVQREQILAYVNSRNEREFLCILPKTHKIKRVWPTKEVKKLETRQAA
jgi:hypothetical protein